MMRMAWLLVILGASCTVVAEEPSKNMFVIEGQVTDHKGKPIQGADIEWAPSQNGRRLREVSRTDNEGRYRVETTNYGYDYRLGVAAEGFAPQWRDGIGPADIKGGTVEVNFELSLPVSLQGRVVDQAGLPIEGVTVTASNPGWNLTDISRFSTPTYGFPFPGRAPSGITDANGDFVIRDLPKTTTESGKPGTTYDLRLHVSGGLAISRQGELNKENVIVADRKNFLTGEEAWGEIRGKVMDALTKVPVKDFKVSIRHRPTTRAFTSESGEFQWQEDLRWGHKHQILVFAMGYAPCIQTTTTSKPADELTQHFELTQAVSLKGMIANKDGEPINNARIVYGLGPADPRSPNNGSWHYFDKIADGLLGWHTVERTTTKEDGAFWFSQYASADEQKAQSINSRNPMTPRMMIKAEGYVPKYVPPDELAKKIEQGIVTIQLSRESKLTIETLHNGELTAQSEVHVSSLNRSAYFGRNWRTESQQNGKFVVAGLGSGPYEISASLWWQSSTATLKRSVDIGEAEATTVKMNFHAGSCTLSGKARPFSRITATPTTQHAGSKLVSVSTTANIDGTYCIDRLPEGVYNVEYAPPLSRYRRFSKPSRLSVPVNLGEATTLDFDDGN